MEWVPSYYDVLANTVGGGKPKMRWHFKENKWPTVTKSDKYGTGEVLETSIQDQLIDDLQDKKTEFYKKIVEEVAQARDGILELMDEAIARPDVAVGICSAATKAGFEKVVNSVVGKERLDKLDVLMAGDDVTKKKPDPLIYNLAREKVDLPAEMCVVIEDSIVGLRAAEGAGMPCIITPCGSTLGQDFKGEGAKFVCATTVKASGVTLSKIFPDGSEKPLTFNIINSLCYTIVITIRKSFVRSFVRSLFLMSHVSPRFVCVKRYFPYLKHHTFKARENDFFFSHRLFGIGGGEQE